jgi:hypothetical protein
MISSILNNFISTFDYSSYGIFIINTFMLFVFFKLLYYYLLYFNNFKNLNHNKKMYIVKNISKAIILSYLNFNTIFYFIPDVFNNIWDDSYIRKLGGFYAASDAAGLLFVPNLPITTKIHHCCTIILYTIVCYISVNKNDLIKLIVCYTIFSSFAFLVNLYLGMRFFIVKDSNNNLQKNINYIIDINKVLAYYSYLFNCILNWGIHILFFIQCIIYNNLDRMYLIYALILIPIIKDDLILLDWLKK